MNSLHPGTKHSLSAGVLIALCCLTNGALAISWTEPFPADSVGSFEFNGPLPEGALRLAKDPLRGTGWHHGFSELPNDVFHFGYEASAPQDVQHLIDLLAEIKSDRRQIFLHPGDAMQGKFIPKRKNGRGFSVVFVMGNQNLLDAWYDRLPKSKNAEGESIRTFGKWTYEERPQAMPPTLNLYLGRLNLNRLSIPENITVHSGVTDDDRKNPDLQKKVRQIDELVAKRKADEPQDE